jgi:hypothetical protein
VSADGDAQTVARELSTIGELTPALFYVPDDERRLDNAAATDLIKGALVQAIARHVPSRYRAATVRRASEPAEARRVVLIATIATPDGREVAQKFEATLNAGEGRARVTRKGVPELIGPTGETLGRISAPSPPRASVAVSAARAAQSAVSERPEGSGAQVQVGAGLALVGAILVLVGSFLPVHSYGLIPVPSNSFASDGNWWLLAMALAMGTGAAYVLLGSAKGRVWTIALFSLGALAGGVYGLTSSFQRLGLTETGERLLGASSIKASPAAGVYLVLAGGAIGLLGALIIGSNPRQASSATSPLR